MSRTLNPLARTLTFALVLSTAVPSNAIAQQPQPAKQPSQPSMPISAPSPIAMPTTAGSPIPYPAYGSPAPDVAAQRVRAGVPTTVSLSQAVDVAVVQSPFFASQRAQYRAIFARYGSELGALYPFLSASGSITKNYGSTSGANAGTGGVGSNGTAVGNAITTTEDARVSLTQLIYDGGRVIAGIRTAKESDIAGRDTLVRQLQTLVFNVASSYYGLLQADASVDADALVVTEFETAENAIRAQIRAGAAARSDLAAAEAQTAQARGALIAAQSFAISAQATFATTLGLDADTAVQPQRLAKSPPQVKILGYRDALNEALNLRPDYLAAIHTVESSKENLRFAKLARFPVIDATASTGTSRLLLTSPSTTAATPFTGTSSLGATISIPIYDQGLTNFNVAVAASQLDQANAAVVSTKLTVQSDVRSALATVISARAALVQAQAGLNSAIVNVQAVQAQYRVGASTITAIVTAQGLFATAASTYVNALYAERISEERYTFALGVSDLSL